MRLIIDGDTIEEINIAMRVATKSWTFGSLAVGQRRGFITFDKDGEPTHETGIIKTKTGYSFKTRGVDNVDANSGHRVGRTAL